MIEMRLLLPAVSIQMITVNITIRDLVLSVLYHFVTNPLHEKKKGATLTSHASLFPF